MGIDGVLSIKFSYRSRGETTMCDVNWVLNVFMDGCMREKKAKLGNVGARLKINGMCWVVVACMFADHMLFAQWGDR